MVLDDDAVAEAVQRVLAAGEPIERAVVIHDIDLMRQRLASLAAAFPRQTLHAVAIKANPVVGVLRAVVDAGFGLEAASFEEVALALAAGAPPDRVVYDAPAKTDGELARALELGLWLHVDTAHELDRVARMGPPEGARVGVRVNPEVGAGRIAMTSTVARGGRFGVPLEQVAQLCARHRFVGGLHVHTGSQGVGLALIGAAVDATADAARACGLRWIDVGGGLPVRYTAADPEPPGFDAWGARVTPACAGLQLLTEPGRAVHAPAGLAALRVAAIREDRGRRRVVVHAGADLFLRWVYAPEQWDHRVLLLDAQGRPRGGATGPVDLLGPLCFAGDVLTRDRPLPAAQPGDLLVVRDAGAYTLSMWSRHCSRGRPAVWGLQDGVARRLLAAESPDDVARWWGAS